MKLLVLFIETFQFNIQAGTKGTSGDKEKS